MFDPCFGRVHGMIWENILWFDPCPKGTLGGYFKPFFWSQAIVVNYTVMHILVPQQGAHRIRPCILLYMRL